MCDSSSYVCLLLNNRALKSALCQGAPAQSQGAPAQSQGAPAQSQGALGAWARGVHQAADWEADKGALSVDFGMQVAACFEFLFLENRGLCVTSERTQITFAT